MVLTAYTCMVVAPKAIEAIEAKVVSTPTALYA